MFSLCHLMQLGLIPYPTRVHQYPTSVVISWPSSIRQFLNWSINEDGAFPELKTSHIFRNTSPFPFLQDSHNFLSVYQTCLVHFKVAPLLVFPNAVVENLPCWVYDYQTCDCYYRGNANSYLLFRIYQCLLNPPWHAVVRCSWFYFSSSLLLPDFSSVPNVPNFFW